MNITLYTDASFKNGKGAWAGCAVLENVVGFEAEEKLKKCHSINYAELYAVYRLLKQTVIEYSNEHTYTLYTDSMSVVRWVNRKTPPKHPTSAKIYQNLIEDISTNSIKLSVNHIQSITTNYYFRNCHSRASTLNI